MVEKLLPFLDLDSTLHLAQTHRVTRELLKKSFVWNKLIRRAVLLMTGRISTTLHHLMTKR